jgi:hypothetical protein
MTEPGPLPKKRRTLRTPIRIFSGVVILLALLVLSVYIVFNFFGAKLLREMLREKVYITSQGLYTIDFSDLKINIFTRSVIIYDFRLTPDTILYQKLRKDGTAKAALYRISYRQLKLQRLNFREIWFNKNVHMREMSIIRPEIVLMGFPDTLSSKKGRFKNVYEDVYPLASKMFREVHIDSIYVERARIISDREGKPGKQAFGEYEFSALLRDVAINPFSYYNHERVFYSRDIDFIIHNVKYSLTDSLYFLQAEEIGFNLVKSRIYGKNVSLRPNFYSRRMLHAHQGIFFQFDVPEFAISGINLYKALTDEKVHLKRVDLSLARLKIFHNSSAEAIANRMKPEHRKKRKPFNKADLYTVISGKLKSLQLDSLLIHEASLEYFRNIYDRNPELRVARVDIAVEEFKLDSLSNKQKDRIFFAKDLDLNLHDIILNLRDQVHVLNAGHVYISTKKRLVDIEDGMLYPDESKNALTLEEQKNTISVLLPELKFTNIDLLKAFYRQYLEFGNLLVESPDVRYNKHRLPLKTAVRFKKPGDFFDESNNDVVYNLLKKYVNSIKGDSIIVNKGFFGYHQFTDTLDQTISSGSFDLKMYDFLIDSVHGMNQQGYFYSKDFDLDFRSFSYISPDSLRQLKVSRMHLATKDSLITADSISFNRTREPATSEAIRKSNVSVNFTLDNLFLQGLNHKKLFLEKVLQANLLRLSNPKLSLKAGDPYQFKPGQDDERIAASQDLIKFLLVKKLSVLKGDISYDGLERTKSSYFKLKDIDFSIQNLDLKIPDRGKTNGSMKFDSVSLSVRPLRMIVMDSTYEVSCDNISLNSYPLNVNLKGVRVFPIMSQGRKETLKPGFRMKIPQISISGFYFDKALFEGRWIVGDINILKPEADITIYGSKYKEKKTFSPALAFKPGQGSFSIEHILVKDAAVKLHIHNEKGITDYSTDELDIWVSKFLLDSLNHEGIKGVPLFNSDDISVSLKGRNFMTGDSLYAFGFKKAFISTGKKYVYLDSIFLTPVFSRDEFYRRIGYQTDIFKVSVPRIKIFRPDFVKMLTGKSVHAGKLVLVDPRTEAYRDKRIKVTRPGKKFLPQSQLRRIHFPLTIDTVQTVDGYMKYEEQTGDEPGYVFFDGINTLVCNLSNDSSVLKNNSIISVEGRSRLMGKGKAQVFYLFDMLNPRDSLWWHGTVDSIDLRDVNPMLSRLMPAKISHGFVDRLNISMVSANDATAVGGLEMDYRDLYVELDLVKTGILKKLKNEVITDIANVILPDDNPASNGKLRKGVIYFQRDTTKAIFNYIWKSTASGLKSSMGFNSQDQLQIKMNLKKKPK